MNQTKRKSLKEVMVDRAHEAKKTAVKMRKSRNLSHSIIYEGTINTLFSKSGAGKSKISVILMMSIAQHFPDKTIYYFAPDLSNDDVFEIGKLVDEKKLGNFLLDQDTTGSEFMQMMEEYSRTNDVKDIIFVVDTLKKIAPVNNKDGMSKTLGTLRQVVSRGATGLLIGHTNKDGHEMSGTAEVEQDVDNVLTIDVKYLEEDKMQSTIKPAPNKRCRSRIGILTLEMDRDGFGYKIIDKPVDSKAILQAAKEAERRGNLIEVAKEIVEEHYEKDEDLTKTKLQEAIRNAETYTGNKKNDVLSKMIDELGEHKYITINKEGRALHCLPFPYSSKAEKKVSSGWGD